ncbi:MAG TPA: class I SAM-dependent methyltransferase [Bryobacteraceae bacterium]|nr:class I SAM-dependent methyltransferase [Bryobacteraceae bacterium]
MPKQTNCPNCLAGEMKLFYEVPDVPVHSVLLMPTREVAVTFPKRDIALGFCRHCGFIGNTVFDPAVHNYSGQYEETQGFSPTFQAFHRRLAQSLIDDYDLRGKTVVEIGCGKGEFLTLLCEMGQNRGIGFDPAFVAERNPAGAELDVQFIADFYSEKYTDVSADFFCCKMTLEHIPNTAEFVGMVRRAIGDRPESLVFFQIPDMHRILRNLAFWDIYYEHCSYFTPPSLIWLFEQAGFAVEKVWTDYEDQYLMITARPVANKLDTSRFDPTVVERVAEDIEHFLTHQSALIEKWKGNITSFRKQNKRAVVWGSGSKGVAFLTALKLNGSIEYVVDINPFRQGKFMAGTGQEIVGPKFLEQYQPDVAIAMNPIYQNEIQTDLRGRGLKTDVLTV